MRDTILPKMDHLQCLPTEILLQIVQDCDDLSALCSLVNTSRRLRAIFETNNPAKIIETVLQSGAYEQLHYVMRMVVYIRAEVYERHQLEDHNPPPLYRFNDDELLNTPLLHKFLHLAHRVHILAHMCLDWCLDRLRGRIQPVKGVTVGPPSWTEEQRTIITLWRVQCFYELKNARIKGRLQNNWDVTKLANLGSTSIYGGAFAPRGFQREQMITSHELLEKIRAEDNMSDIGQLPKLDGLSRRKFKKRPKVLLRLPNPANHSRCCETPLPSPSARQSASERISKEPTAWVYLHRFRRPNDAEEYPLQKLPIEPFRNLGVFLCDRERLADLGLWPDPDRDVLEFDEGPGLFSAWMGLLTPEEIALGLEDEEDDW